MEAKYGRDVVDDLEAIAGPYKWTREELEDIRRYYRGKINDILAGIDPNPKKNTSVISIFAGTNND